MKSPLPCAFLFVFCFLVENASAAVGIVFFAGENKRLKIREVQIHVEVFCIINRMLERFNFISLDRYFSLRSQFAR
jgi:hypothetical protein